MTWLNSNEIDRYIDSYVKSDTFVKHCIEAVSIIDIGLDLRLLVVAEYGPGVLEDAAAAPEWMVGRPWLTDTGTVHNINRTTTTTNDEDQ
jgi:hypothetical protein